MRELGLEGAYRRRYRRITEANEHAAAAPDLVRRNFRATYQLWVADITYVRTWQDWLYVAVVVDTFSRRAVGWSMPDDLHAELVVDALQIAVWRRRPTAGLVHHSDRGSHYTGWAIGGTLRDSGILQSMGSRGDAYQHPSRELYVHARDRAHRPPLLAYPRRRPPSHLRLHRTLVQPPPAPLSPRHHSPADYEKITTKAADAA
jgi:putative transposase